MELFSDLEVKEITGQVKSFDHHKQSPEITRSHRPVLSFTHAIVLPIINIADHLACPF